MLSYNDLGTGTPVVLIHGLGSKKEAWLPQHDLANRYRLIIPDMRGHGETVINEDLTVKNFALDIIKLLENLNIPSAFICGLSLGGIVAQELYKQRPDMVKGLILANTTSYIPSIFANNIINQSYELLRKGNQELVEHIVMRGLYDKVYKEEARNAFYIRDTYIESAKAPVGLNYFSVLPTIRKPVLLIGSTHDKVTPSYNLYLMKPFIRHSKTVLLKNTGHLSNIEKKDLFNRHVTDFIDTCA
ncbi:alpha/beta fold hydrolase [Metabacillus sp. RGM 3146]|uniref:alpha/beta fold hydrolase n=1 Tax=Metabacillus sp. RGM 3146 TaxID=3401092 RepID=UPI003B9A0519